jgi:hypothetical protein
MAKAQKAEKTEKAETKAEPVERVRHWLDDKFLKRIKAAKDADKSVAEIAKDEGVSKGQVAYGLLRAEIPAKDRQSLEDDEATLATETVRLRDTESKSWGIISATLGVAESRVRSVYAEATGKDHKGNRIGKGGRHPGDVDAENSPAAQKAGATKKAGAPTGKIIPIPEMNKAQITERVVGETMTVGRGAGKTQKFKVKSVKSLKNGELEFVDEKNGSIHTVKTEDITKVSRTANK